MGTTMNRKTYVQCIKEDIDWLRANTERSLEQDHILQILNWSVGVLYPPREPCCYISVTGMHVPLADHCTHTAVAGPLHDCHVRDYLWEEEQRQTDADERMRMKLGL